MKNYENDGFLLLKKFFSEEEMKPTINSINEFSDKTYNSWEIGKEMAYYETSTTNENERIFIINHLKKNLKVEYVGMINLLEEISFYDKGTIRNSQLRSKMATYIRDNGSPAVDTMLTGMLSRAFELKLIEKQKSGLSVYYKLSEFGKKIMEDK